MFIVSDYCSIAIIFEFNGSFNGLSILVKKYLLTYTNLVTTSLTVRSMKEMTTPRKYSGGQDIYSPNIFPLLLVYA